MSDETEPNSHAAALVSQYLDNFGGWVSDEYEAKARDLAWNAEINEPINRAPSSIAAGAIYAAGLLVNEKRTQAEVAGACDVTKPTIRETYTEIIEAEGYEVEPQSKQGGSYTHLGRFEWARIGWGAASMTSGLALAVAIKTNQIGPRSLWASDACADPAHLCGQIPLAAPVSVGFAVAVLWLGWVLLGMVESRAGDSE